MAGNFPKNHDHLYFDALCRTKKAESVFSLILATYQVKLHPSNNDKELIAKKLVNAYELLKGSAGSYSGIQNQFDSQYTIGHELGIWKDSELNLSPLAEKVAKFEITIREYFDIWLLNYIQPINHKVVHLFYHLLKYMLDHKLTNIDKSQIAKIYMDLSNSNSEGEINGFSNILISSDYFIADNSTLIYVGKDPLELLISKCDIKYDLKMENEIREVLDTSEKYLAYLLKENNNSTYHYNKVKQIVYYGVPGSGKSHKIEEDTYKISDERKIRVVFHPEYTNADFIGQIVPCIDGNVEYKFKAGPFSRILKKALKDPVNQYFLIIEEINRGNAAAIFGDLFQLLDRNKYGWSEYGIDNFDINAFIRSESDFYSDKDAPSCISIENNTFTENTSIKLPPNLSILATMNSSDQNVFTLDNAFQRRWELKLITNNFSEHPSEEEKYQRDAIIECLNITWETFREQINSMILQESKDSGLSSMEDKRLGPWFIKAKDNKIDSEAFADKVLKYLWDDAFKFSRSNVFEDSLDSFEKVRTAFLSEQKIFRNLDLKSINSETTETYDESLETSEE